MKFTNVHMAIVGLVAIVIGATIYGFTCALEGFQYSRLGGSREGFKSWSDDQSPVCDECSKPVAVCACPKPPVPLQPPIAPCPRTMEPDLSKYILKSQIPSTQSMIPDMTNYMLKTECPPVPDLSKYILKSSIPKPQPVIIDNSKCKSDVGECPPCPRPRCPTVSCPAPVKCAPPAPCPRPVCPPTVVKCKSEESTSSTVRPFLAPLSLGGFGMA